MSSVQLQIPTVDSEYVDIPETHLRVSRVALGTWAMGGWMWGGTDQRESVATIQAAVHQGINLIDTAPAYGFGVSEEIVGTAVEGRRHEVVIATKVGLEWRDGKVFRNASRARIQKEIDDSLRRLRTDYIDIYQVHWPDPLVPVEETAEVMRSLYEQGKIRAIGVSNFSVAQMERFRQVAPLHVMQPPYNLFERAIEEDILPYSRDNQIVTLGYGALCRGLLSGRMRPDTVFDGDDLRRIDPKFQPPRFAQYLDAVRAGEGNAAIRAGHNGRNCRRADSVGRGERPNRGPAARQRDQRSDSNRHRSGHDQSAGSRRKRGDGPR